MSIGWLYPVNCLRQRNIVKLLLNRCPPWYPSIRHFVLWQTSPGPNPEIKEYRMFSVTHDCRPETLCLTRGEGGCAFPEFIIQCWMLSVDSAAGRQVIARLWQVRRSSLLNLLSIIYPLAFSNFRRRIPSQYCCQTFLSAHEGILKTDLFYFQIWLKSAPYDFTHE